MGPLVDPDEFPDLEVAVWLDTRGMILNISFGYRLEKKRLVRDLRAKWEVIGRPQRLEATTAALATALMTALPSVSVRQISPPAILTMVQQMYAVTEPERIDPIVRAERSPTLCAYYAPEVLRAGARISQLTPWEVLDETQHVVIEVPGVELTHEVFIVIGGSGEQRGFVGYRTREDVLRSRNVPDVTQRLHVAGTVLGALFDDAEELSEWHIQAFGERGFGHLTYFPVGLWHTLEAPSNLTVHDLAHCRSLAAAMEAFAEAAPLLMRAGVALPKTVSVTTPTFGPAKVTLHPAVDDEDYDDDGEHDDASDVHRGPIGARVPPAVAAALTKAAGMAFSPLLCPLRDGEAGMAYAHMNPMVQQMLVMRGLLAADAPTYGRVLAHLGYAADVQRMLPWFMACDRLWMVEYEGAAYLFVQTLLGLQFANFEPMHRPHMVSVRDEGIRDGFVWLGAFSGGPRPRTALRLDAMKVIVRLPFQYVRA